MMTLEGETSGWVAVALAVIDKLLVPLVAVLAAWLYKKLGAIHTLVNGNLHAAQQKVNELRAKLQELGVNPDE